MYVACLMAGASSRLLPLTKVNHKSLLRVGNLRVIDVQMKTFALAGLDTFSFVVGHGGSRLANHLLANYSSVAVSIINNNYFASRNLDWSAYLALSSRRDDVMYYEGDIIAAPDIIRQVAMHSGDVCVAMDTGIQSARVDTRVLVGDDRVSELVFSEHGDLDRTSATSSGGEFLCFAKLSNRAREYVVKRLEKQPCDGPMKLYGIFNDLFQQYPSHVVTAAGRPWVEIDNKDDLLRARAIVDRIFTTQPADTSHMNHD